MSTLDVFCWAVKIASIITVVIWGVVACFVVACFVLQGMFNLCRDVWRALRSKA